MNPFFAFLLGASVLLAVPTASADDRTEYNRRAAARFAELFKSLDRDNDGTVSRAEALGDLNLGPRFEDMDIDRNGILTAAELQRFVAQEFGVDIASQR